MLSLYKTEKSRWIMGIFLIITIYTLFYLYFAESVDARQLPRRIRHIIKFATTFSVYLVGTFHLGKLRDKWMDITWHFIHISLMSLLVLIGLYDWTIGSLSQEVKDLTASIQEFLISPVLYVGMGIVNKRLNSSS